MAPVVFPQAAALLLAGVLFSGPVPAQVAYPAPQTVEPIEGPVEGNMLQQIAGCNSLHSIERTTVQGLST